MTSPGGLYGIYILFFHRMLQRRETERGMSAMEQDADYRAQSHVSPPKSDLSFIYTEKESVRKREYTATRSHFIW